MQVWTVVNQKGGVGKTTSSISLAGCLSSLGYKVLLIDLDPQASLTHYLGYDSETLSYNVYDLFIASQHLQSLNKVFPEVLLDTQIKNVTLIPSHMALATLDRSLAEQKGKGLIIKNLIKSSATNYDYVIIDCQPVLGVLMVNALLAAKQIILPTQTEHLAKLGLKKMLLTLAQMHNNLEVETKTWVVPTMFDRRLKACVSAFESLRDMFNPANAAIKGHVTSLYPRAHLWRGYIPLDTKFREASVLGKPINETAANSRGCFAYQKLTGELIKNA